MEHVGIVRAPANYRARITEGVVVRRYRGVEVCLCKKRIEPPEKDL